jgi:hypothetical protein
MMAISNLFKDLISWLRLRFRCKEMEEDTANQPNDEGV